MPICMPIMCWLPLASSAGIRWRRPATLGGLGLVLSAPCRRRARRRWEEKGRQRARGEGAASKSSALLELGRPRRMPPASGRGDGRASETGSSTSKPGGVAAGRHRRALHAVAEQPGSRSGDLPRGIRAGLRPAAITRRGRIPRGGRDRRMSNTVPSERGLVVHALDVGSAAGRHHGAAPVLQPVGVVTPRLRTVPVRNRRLRAWRRPSPPPGMQLRLQARGKAGGAAPRLGRRQQRSPP